MVRSFTTSPSVGVRVLIGYLVLGGLIVPISVQVDVQVWSDAHSNGFFYQVKEFNETTIRREFVRRVRMDNSISGLQLAYQAYSLSFRARVSGQFVGVAAKFDNGGRGTVDPANAMRYHDDDIFRGERTIGSFQIGVVRVAKKCFRSIRCGRQVNYSIRYEGATGVGVQSVHSQLSNALGDGGADRSSNGEVKGEDQEGLRFHQTSYLCKACRADLFLSTTVDDSRRFFRLLYVFRGFCGGCLTISRFRFLNFVSSV